MNLTELENIHDKVKNLTTTEFEEWLAEQVQVHVDEAYKSGHDDGYDQGHRHGYNEGINE